MINHYSLKSPLLSSSLTPDLRSRYNNLNRYRLIKHTLQESPTFYASAMKTTGQYITLASLLNIEDPEERDEKARRFFTRMFDSISSGCSTLLSKSWNLAKSMLLI